MSTSYTYACKDYPGMDECPGRFTAQTREEAWKLAELHAEIAHGENPSAWDDRTKDTLKALIKAD
jgi:hypothetical protein